MRKRELPNWLDGLRLATARTEAPEHFWLWSGISTLAGALGRKCFLDYGLEKLLPNLYVMLVAPPGKCRKGGPISLARRLLKAVQSNIAVDSTSKESLTRELADMVATITVAGRPEQHSCITIASKELSSLLAIDPKKMIEALTDLFDFHEDSWEYKTKHGRADKVYGPFVNLFAATTPYYIANNIPYEAFGAGFFSRVIFVVGKEKKQRIAIPQRTTDEEQLYELLKKDLNHISHLRGEFFWARDAMDFFESWYNTLPAKKKEVHDERFHGFVERCHIHVLKIAMCLHAAYSDQLAIELPDIKTAIGLIEEIFTTLEDVFGGLGRSDQGLTVFELQEQLKEVRVVSLSDLYKRNWRNMSGETLREVIEDLWRADMIDIEDRMRSDGRPDKIITWKGEKSCQQ